MFQLLKIDPNERITWDDYFNHSFFIDNKKKLWKFLYKKEKIGGVRFSSVYKAIKKDKGEKRALKIISKILFNIIVSKIKENSYTF